MQIIFFHTAKSYAKLFPQCRIYLSALSLALYLSFSLIFLLETHFKSIDSCCIFALVSFFCELKICCRCIYFRLFGINRSCVRFVVVVVRCACYPDAFCLLMHFFTCFSMQFKVVLCIFMTLLKSFVLQPFAVSHTHTHTLNLPLMPRVSRCTSVYSRCSCAFFTHSQIENVRPHFQLYHIISYSCCALDLFLPFFFLLLSISFTICCNIRHSLWHSVSILFCCSSALFIFYWNWKVFVLR